MKHDKDKADRLAHLLLAQLCGTYDMSDEFGRVSAVLLRSINGNDLSKKVLALRSYGALVQRGCGADAVRATVVPLVRTLSEATLLFADKKKLSSKDAATLWETNAVLECALLVLRYLTAAAPASAAADTDGRLLAALVVALQSPDAPVARHAAALLREHARRDPRAGLAALQRAFGAPSSQPQPQQPQHDLFALPVWHDVLGGAHLAQTLVCLAAAAGTSDADRAQAVQWAAHGLAVPGPRAKVFVATVAALAEHWALVRCAAAAGPDAPTLLEAAVARLDALLRAPHAPAGATQALLRSAETLGRALVRHSAAAEAAEEGEEETEKEWSVLARLQDALRRHAEAPGAGAVVRGQALTALLWVAPRAEAVRPLAGACAAVFARAPAVFAEVWRSYEARARTAHAFAAPLLDASLHIVATAGGGGATEPFPQAPFCAAWATALRCDAPATRAHLLALLRTVPAPEARAPLHATARCACVFIGDHARELLGLAPACTPSTAAEQQQQQQHEEELGPEGRRALVALLEALEAHALAGTPLDARRDAVEALARVGLAVPAARAHVRECLAALDGTPGLDDACGTLAALVAALDEDGADGAAVRARLQTYFNPAVFVL